MQLRIRSALCLQPRKRKKPGKPADNRKRQDGDRRGPAGCPFHREPLGSDDCRVRPEHPVGFDPVELELVRPGAGADRLRLGQRQLLPAAADCVRRPDAVGARQGHQRRLRRPEQRRLRHQRPIVHQRPEHAGCGLDIGPDRHRVQPARRAQHDRHRPDARGQRRATDGNADGHRLELPGQPLGLHDALQPRGVHAAVAVEGGDRRSHLAAMALDGGNDVAHQQPHAVRHVGARHVQDQQLQQRLLLGPGRGAAGQLGRQLHDAGLDHARGQRAVQPAEQRRADQPVRPDHGRSHDRHHGPAALPRRRQLRFVERSRHHAGVQHPGRPDLLHQQRRQHRHPDLRRRHAAGRHDRPDL